MKFMENNFLRNSFLKTCTVILIVLSMTMANFIFVGKGLISYAAENVSTNHQNVEFEAYFKDADGNKTSIIETNKNENNADTETFLYLSINVKKEGYFNGKIQFSNNNFTLKESDNEYVNKIEDNTIYLNQINMGLAKEIKVKIEPIENEKFELNLLDSKTQIDLSGIYRDSTQKNINIKATRELVLKTAENNTEENILNDIKVITNKIEKINGEDKRIVQFSYNMGLKENNYPMKKIDVNIQLPETKKEINEDLSNTKENETTNSEVAVTAISYLNNMTSFDYSNNDNNIELLLENPSDEEEKINWKKQGFENIIVTCIYDKEIDIANSDIITTQKITLYNDKEIGVKQKIAIEEETVDNIIQINSRNLEESIYKGKLNAEIARTYMSQTELNLTYIPAIENIELVEDESRYAQDTTETPANVIYNNVFIKKDNFNELFKEEGQLDFYDQNDVLLGTITNETEADEQDNLNLSFEEKNVTKLKVIITNLNKEGKLKLLYTKTINGNKDAVKDVNELKTKTILNYNETGKQEQDKTIKLENTTTEAKLEVNKDTLSTAIPNEIELKATLLCNNEKYDLFKNPQITIEMPEQVENIEINNAGIVYGNGLSTGSYSTDGRFINLSLTGEQTEYNKDVINGTTIVLNATVLVNKHSASKDAQIKMTYTNEKDATYTSGDARVTSTDIRIVAPKDVTTIYNVEDLGVETIGQETQTEVLIEKGAEAKQLEAQIEIINNNENSIEDIKVLGNLPTDNDDNNMGVQMVNGLSMQGAENISIYYSENPDATDDLQDEKNGWSNEIYDFNKVNKYLITADKIDAGNSLQGSYTYAVPANLDYNKIAKSSYAIKNIDSQTQIQSELFSTEIAMKTGVGKEVKGTLTAQVGGKEISGPVKNGEVIRYNIEVSNTGTEDVSNITVTGQVPEGTALVEPVDNFVYSGETYYNETDTQTFNTNIEELKAGETTNIQYEVRVKKDTRSWTTIK